MFKIAYCAGHFSGTPGKRLPAELDPAQTREWTLNDRVADYFAQAAEQYEGVALLRTDDPTGKTDILIKDRTAKANAWGAQVYVDMHHNAGIDLGTGGGVVAFCYPGSAKGRQYRDAIYAAVIAAGGLKGNRSQPLQEKAFDSLRYASAPAVLMEYGFMDSRTDAPVILTDAYAKAVAYATMDGIAQVAGLKKKAAPVVKPAPMKTAVCTVELEVLKKGSEGGQIKALQQLLNANGYNCGTADGIFGAKTDAALRAYQKAKGLTVDGICGAKTWAKLLNRS